MRASYRCRCEWKQFYHNTEKKTAIQINGKTQLWYHQLFKRYWLKEYWKYWHNLCTFYNPFESNDYNVLIYVLYKINYILMTLDCCAILQDFINVFILYQLNTHMLNALNTYKYNWVIIIIFPIFNVLCDFQHKKFWIWTSPVRC